MRASRIVLPLLVVFVSCIGDGRDPFYSRVDQGDWIRIPLIKPYQLLNQASADPNIFGTHGWELDFYFSKYDSLFHHVNVSHVNIEKGIIYGHGKDGMTGFPNYWFAVIPQKKLEKVFKKSDEWELFLRSNNIDPKKLYYVWDLREQFTSKKTLPWMEQIKKD